MGLWKLEEAIRMIFLICREPCREAHMLRCPRSNLRGTVGGWHMTLSSSLSSPGLQPGEASKRRGCNESQTPQSREESRLEKSLHCRHQKWQLQSPQLRSQARGPPLAFSHTDSNPLANPFGSAFSSQLPSDVSHYFHGSHSSPGQHYHSPGLLVTSSLVALMSPSSLTVYTGARVAISRFHFNGLI